MTPKALVVSIALILIACGAAVISSYVAEFGFVKLGYHSVRFGLTCALAISLIRGSTSGRWITVGLICLGLGSLALIGESLVTAGCSRSGLIILGLLHAGCLLGLITPFAGRHFGRKASAKHDSDGKASAAIS